MPITQPPNHPEILKCIQNLDYIRGFYSTSFYTIAELGFGLDAWGHRAMMRMIYTWI
jgi:hypothetical protein